MSPQTFTAPSADSRYRFARDDLMQIGVYYYPEAWPRDQWARDIANIRKLGFEFIHLAEFAWTFLQPEEGRFDFGWLDDTLELADQHQLKVVLCTPSAAPPVWLTEKNPEVLMVDANGRRQQHGTRQHACWNVDSYRQHVGRIVTELAQRYGQDPRIWGWPTRCRTPARKRIRGLHGATSSRRTPPPQSPRSPPTPTSSTRARRRQSRVRSAEAP